MPWHSELERLFPGACFFDAPLASWTSWKLGGPAECLVAPRDGTDLARVFIVAKDEGIPLWILGGGTNVLVPDEGLEGITLHTGNLTGIISKPLSDGNLQLVCEAGVPLKELLRLSLRQGLGGLEFTAGIPGSVGGALIGNAGASGKGVGDTVSWVETLDRSGQKRVWERQHLHFSYRKSSLQGADLLVLRCGLSLKPMEREILVSGIRKQMALRSSQPHGAKTAGCVFKNPDRLAAGKLLEDAGCKGLQRGSVAVSASHSNFFVNRGGGTASEMWELILYCREKVFRNSGILLDLEVTLLGESWE